MIATTPYKVQVKLGQAEFSAEGPEETVKQQLEHFFSVASAPSMFAPIKENGNGGHANGNGHGASDGSVQPMDTFAVQGANRLSPELVKRLFADDGRIVSVKRLPVSDERDADVLFLILLGYLIHRKQEKVKASEMLAAAKQSGIRLDRIDNVLDKFDQLVVRGGFKRGSWYCLTNPGQEHAEEIAARIFS